jgi:uncharacterized cupredoxin-like copper-binding protein
MAINFPEGWQDYPSRFANIVQHHNPTQYSFQGYNGSWANAPNMSASITPRATSSQVLVIVSLNAVATNTAFFRVVRNGTAVGNGTSGTGNMSNVWAGSYYHQSDLNHGTTMCSLFLDSPSSTSSVTYQVQMSTDNGGGGWIYLNHNNNGSNAFIAYHAQSTITLLEVEAV